MFRHPDATFAENCVYTVPRRFPLNVFYSMAGNGGVGGFVAHSGWLGEFVREVSGR
jgi:hypothetical protein